MNEINSRYYGLALLRTYGHFIRSQSHNFILFSLVIADAEQHLGRFAHISSLFFLLFETVLRPWQTRTNSCGHIVADTLLPMMFLGLRKLGNICCVHRMFLHKIRNIFCAPDTKFVSATNVARAGKRGNICVGKNVSARICPRLPGP